LQEERPLQVENIAHDCPNLISQIKPKICRYLIIAASACAQFSAQFSKPGNEMTLDGRVDIFILRLRADTPVRNLNGEFAKSAIDSDKLSVRK